MDKETKTQEATQEQTQTTPKEMMEVDIARQLLTILQNFASYYIITNEQTFTDERKVKWIKKPKHKKQLKSKLKPLQKR